MGNHFRDKSTNSTLSFIISELSVLDLAEIDFSLEGTSL